MRLDLTNQNVQEDFEFIFNEDDPGATNNGMPIDLCYWCFHNTRYHSIDESPYNPPYEEGEYICARCGEPLDSQSDNLG